MVSEPAGSAYRLPRIAPLARARAYMRTDFRRGRDLAIARRGLADEKIADKESAP